MAAKRFLLSLAVLCCCITVSSAAFSLCSGPTYSLSSFTNRIYYVSVSGSDSNSGLTPQTAWRSLAHAASTATANSTVIFLGGVYSGVLSLSRSGVPNGYITFISYSSFTGLASDRAIIDGSALTPDYGGLVQLSSVSYVAIIGFEIRNYVATTSDQVPYGIYISGTGANILIRGNYIHEIITPFGGSGGNAGGISIKGDGSGSLQNIQVDYNELARLQTGSSESMTFNGNVVNFQALWNYVHDCNNIGIDIAGGYGVSSNPLVDHARHGLVYGNVFYNVSSAYNPAYSAGCYCVGSIYVDGGWDTIIANNLVSKGDYGIAISSELAGTVAANITVNNNVIWNSNTVGASIGGYNDAVGTAKNVTFTSNYFYNNQILASQIGYGEFHLNWKTTQLLVQSNTFYDSDPSGANTDALYVSSSATQQSAVFTQNTFLSPMAQGAWEYLSEWYGSITTWQAAVKGSSANVFTRLAAPASICTLVPCDTSGVPLPKCTSAYTPIFV